MVVCPLAVLDNWAKEFARFAPDIPFVTYYGTKEERAEIRRTKMVKDAVDEEYYQETMKKLGLIAAAAAPAASSKGKGKGKGKAPQRAQDGQEKIPGVQKIKSSLRQARRLLQKVRTVRLTSRPNH